MKVAIITETFLPQVNGVVRTLEKIILHLEANGHEALLITMGDGEDFYSQTTVVRVPAITFKLYPELNLVKPEDKWLEMLLESNITQLPMAGLNALLPGPNSVVEKALNKFKPDIIHLATPVTLGAVGQFYVEKLKLPCLATFHTDIASYAPRYQIPFVEDLINVITKQIYQRANRVLAPSPSSQKQLEKIGITNVGVFGRGVDHTLFNPIKASKQVLSNYSLDPETCTITYVGRLAEEKSIPELVDAFQAISKTEKIQLLLVGDGPIRQDLEQSLKGYKFAFTGIKKGEELAQLYASSDIFAFPSRTETFGQVVLEAMSSGLPIVGYDSPGVRDLVKHGQNGLLASDEQGFKYYLEKLISDKLLREKFAADSVNEASSRSWQKILDGLLNEYESLIHNMVSKA